MNWDDIEAKWVEMARRVGSDTQVVPGKAGPDEDPPMTPPGDLPGDVPGDLPQPTLPEAAFSNLL